MIEKYTVFYGDTQLPWRMIGGQLQYEKYMDVNAGVIFRIPANTENEDAIITVKNGKKKLRQPIKFRDIPIGS